MKVFISWSGELSRKIALILRGWLPGVIQTVEPFLSTEDIEKGSQWFNELSKQLQDTEFSLVCLTPDNLNKPWILFEAGAACKASDRSRVWTLLFGLSSSDVQGPLAQFQYTLPNKEDMHKLMKSMNSALGEKQLEVTLLDRVFDKWWTDFEDQVSKAMAQLPGLPDPSQKRSERDILEEVLTLCRSMAQEASSKSQAEESIMRRLNYLYTTNIATPSSGWLAGIAFPDASPHTPKGVRSALNPRGEVIEEDDSTKMD